MTGPVWLRREGEDLVLHVLIQPRASKDAIAGIQGDELKIRITAPPVDGKANAHLVKFLAKRFKIPKTNILIEAGETGRHKRLRILSASEALKALIRACG